MVPCLIPLKDGHSIHPDVISGLLRQTVSVSIIPVSRPAVGGRYESQAITRNRAIQLLPEIAHEGYAMMCDRDTLLTDTAAVEGAITKLGGDDGLKCVHFRLKDVVSHHDLGCFVFKVDIAPKIAFYASNGGGCNCGSLTKSLEANRWRQDWLDSEKHGSVFLYTE
jgi:hypothetical protein